jgi:hypothetical protein
VALRRLNVILLSVTSILGLSVTHTAFLIYGRLGPSGNGIFVMPATTSNSHVGAARQVLVVLTALRGKAISAISPTHKNNMQI